MEPLVSSFESLFRKVLLHQIYFFQCFFTTKKTIFFSQIQVYFAINKQILKNHFKLKFEPTRNLSWKKKKNCSKSRFGYFFTMIYSCWPSWLLSKLATYGICWWQLNETWCSHKWPLVPAVGTFFDFAAAGDLHGQCGWTWCLYGPW